MKLSVVSEGKPVGGIPAVSQLRKPRTPTINPGLNANDLPLLGSGDFSRSGPDPWKSVSCCLWANSSLSIVFFVKMQS